MKKLFCLLALAMSAPALAQPQTLMNEWDDRYYLYRDATGCVLYMEFDQGTMIRIASRPAENVLYVNITSDAFADLSSQVGSKADFGLYFKRGEMSFGYVARGQIIKGVDGRFGYGGTAVPPEMLIDLAHEGKLTVKPNIGTETKGTYLFDITGVAPAAHALGNC
jgi:hypothetical protein